MVEYLLDILGNRAQHQSEQQAYIFLQDGETEKQSITYQELDRQAKAVASILQSWKGERALLMYPSGLEFITAFFGCLYAGVIAVPVYPPRRNRNLSRLLSIVNDAQAGIVLTTTSILKNIDQRWEKQPELAQLKLIATDTLTSDSQAKFTVQSVNSKALAFLQYTSGSTGTPKGVMVSHENIIHNQQLIQQAFGHNKKTIFVGWLPLFHDMGLIGNVIQPMYLGIPCILMPPAAFLQKPIRWLQAISKYRATTSGGPNFAYDLCVNKIRPEELVHLDLRSWDLAFNGAEPVRAETLKNFAHKFAACGFRASAFYPCYGMAESTLLATGGNKHQKAVIREVKAEDIKKNLVVNSESLSPGSREFVGCGYSRLGTKVVIVNQDSLTSCEMGKIGEIWLSGDSIAAGYWNLLEATQETFQAYLQDTGEGPFLRTGDLGFLDNKELFVTGRLKDLIIIRGQNHYPQDIEITVEKSHPALRKNSSAAFTINVADGEGLVVVCEIERTYLRKLNPDDIVRELKIAISIEHELDLHGVMLLKPGSIPKTSSGKIQRRVCKTRFLESKLNNVIWKWLDNNQQLSIEPSSNSSAKFAPEHSQTTAEIEIWLLSKIAKMQQIPIESVDLQQPLAVYGLNSVKAVTIAAELGEWLSIEVEPTIAYDYPSIRALAKHLGKQNYPDHALPATTNFQPKHETIAIIGKGCRLPKAENPEAFWSLLRTGRDAISRVPVSRWDSDNEWGGFLDRVNQFDPQFFNISPREANNIDPQQRLLLEVGWEALENAGLVAEKLAGSRSGIFIGISSGDYAKLAENLHTTEAYYGTGNALSVAANRLSYFLDWHGPSWAVDTACSSSLVAVHQACQSLLLGECNLALAGGVNLILSPQLTMTFSDAKMMAADGRCKTFDAEADGYVRSEGCGVVVLKRLSDAIADGDNIQAVIRGSAVNHDGLTNGLTAPNGNYQQEVIRLALAQAGVRPNQISYVETHGTGTSLGDPIEVSSLKAVLMEGREADQLCWIGSVKTNIGHLEAAAGIAGLIKVVLSLEHDEIPPHLHLNKLNPYIKLDKTAIQIPTQLQQWSTIEQSKLAGVSAFGFGGTNAHVILESAPIQFKMSYGEGKILQNNLPEDRNSTKLVGENLLERSVHLLTLSAKTETGLKDIVSNYQNHLENHHSLEIADVCFTANTKRSHFNHRLAIIASNRQELVAKLAKINSGENIADVFSKELFSNHKTPKIAFLFTGQGSQYTNMGYQLYKTQPIFKQAINKCAELMKPYLEQSLLSILYPEKCDNNLINQTNYAQPSLFALEYALFQLWQSWGVVPDAVLGHSVGEYVAAVVAGVVSLADGVKLVTARAKLMQSLPATGEMVTVFATPDEVQKVVTVDGRRLSFAVYNNPQNTTISGEISAITLACNTFANAGIGFKKLRTSHAFHSVLMKPIIAEFRQIIESISYHSAQIPIISNLNGRQINTNEINAEYWCQHMWQTVRFSDGLQTLDRLGVDIFLEVGPKRTLRSIGQRHPCTDDRVWLNSLRFNQEDWMEMLNSLAQLYVSGVKIDWVEFDRDYARQSISLPTYPFQRKSYWIDAVVEMNPSTFQSSCENSILTSSNLSPTSVDMTNKQHQQNILEQLHINIAKLLRAELSEVDVNAPFLEMGADSLVLVEAIGHVERDYGLKISIRQIFEELTTISLLAEYIHKQIPSEITLPEIESEPVMSANRQSANNNSLKNLKLNKFPSKSETIVEVSSRTIVSAGGLERIMQQQLQVVSDTMSDIVAQQLTVLQNQVENFKSDPNDADAKRIDAGKNQPVKTDEYSQSRSSALKISEKSQSELVGQFIHSSELNQFINFYTQRTSSSKNVTQDSRIVLADSRASAGFRPSLKELVYPIIGERAEGAYFWDIDGNKYIDLTMGFGVLLFGHNPQFVKNAIGVQMERGLQIGPQAQLAGEAARLLAELTNTERVVFCNSGTEAVMTAIRLARHKTSRNKIVIFTNSYHGHLDGILAKAMDNKGQSIPSTTGIAPMTVSDVLVLEYGKNSALKILQAHVSEIAAVIVEPVQSRNLDLQPREFLHQLRHLTKVNGIALIFDEVLLGFRIHQGGAQAWFEINADIVTYGKIVGGGLPIGVVAGSKEYLNGIDGGSWSYGNSSYPSSEKTFFAGTFNKNHLGMAVSCAVLQYLKAAGPSLQIELNQRTRQLVSTLNDFFTAEDVPIKVVNFGSVFRFDFKGNFDLFFYYLISKGIYIWEGRACFLSTAHTDDDINQIVKAVQATVQEMRANGFLTQSSSNNRASSFIQEQATKVSSTTTTQVEKYALPSSSRIWNRQKSISSRANRKSANLNKKINSNSASSQKKLDFSLYYFGEYKAQFNKNKYDLLFAGAKFADQHDFTAVWIPERHFHSFGGFSPNPSVLGAALARETNKIQLRAGSVVLPLHNPIRVAEEWSVVDNLSKGRVGIAFASGWHPNDFVFAPESYGNHRELMFQGIETVEKLWRGESIPMRGGAGNKINVQSFPLPMQPQLPTWITVVNNPETYIKAGEIGAGVLTNLMNQNIEDLAEKIALYRESLSKNGYDSASGKVTVLLHTFIGKDLVFVRQQARQPFCNYLKSSLGLFQNLVKSHGLQVDIDSLSADDENFILSAAYERYVQNSALIGTPDSCASIVDNLLAIGVDEIACFIDFGVNSDVVLTSLPYIDQLRERYQNSTAHPVEKNFYINNGDSSNASKSSDWYPLSISQKRFSRLSQLGEAGKKAGNNGFTIKFSRAVNSTILRNAWQELVARHDCLKTVINVSQEIQKLSDSVLASFVEVEEDNLDILKIQANQSFDLVNGPLIKATLVKTDNSEYYFCLVGHHTAIGGYSFAILLQELFTIYQAYRNKTIPKLNSPFNYRGYVNEESQLFSKEALSYWLEQYKQYNPRSLFKSINFNEKPFVSRRLHCLVKIKSLKDSFKRFSRLMNCSPFIMLFSLFQNYLHQEFKQDVFIINVPNATGNANLAGCCVNILPIICGKKGWKENPEHFLKEVKQDFFEAFEQRNFNYQHWLEVIKLPSKISQVSFNLDRKINLSLLDNNTLELITLPVNHAEFPLMVNVLELENALKIEIDYQKQYFTQVKAKRILSDFSLIIKQYFS
ncbi:type I polyketide synthase [Pleurocapsa sp. PCC 7319]|uniref:type I polyketide synthase n=1 Tax=Pleurocapsa sp. PCC 7319 TaxID=118161 RepID=UPI0003467413|nr:type I polyketide synthase [Pleurocapsa sp. PCC 7319]